MTDLAERTTGSTLVEEIRPTRAPGRTPPEHVPPVTPPPPTPWPSRARLVIAVLAVATLLGAAGTIIGFTSGDDPSSTEQVETLTAERDDLAGQVTELQSSTDALVVERDGLAGQVTELDTTIATITTQRDDLAVEVTDLESMIDDIAAAREDLVDQVTEFTVERAALVAEVADLEADLADETAERQALAALFPITFDASLEGVTASELAGTYDASFDAAYCNGLATCGTALSMDELILRETPEGYLEVVIDGMVTTDLYRVDGALYGVADSMPAVAACGTTPRVARVGVAIFAHGVTVADDGTHQVTDLGATMTIQSEAAGTCGSGMAFYGTQLTPQA